MVIISWYIEIILPRIFSGAISDRYSGAVYEATPTARPSSTRETSRISTFGAAAENREPATKRMAPIIRLFLRPSLKESQPLPTAPTAAPNIMELTTHSWVWAEIWNSLAIKGKAPAITPISRPNSRPASAARKQTKNVIVLFERPCFLLSGITPSS